MKRHNQGCPKWMVQGPDNIPFHCACPEVNDYATYVSPVDRTPEIIELLKEIIYFLKQLPRMK